MTKRLTIAVLCGGQSAEHEVSLMSAHNVVTALNPKKYNIEVIYISQQGHWYRLASAAQFLKIGAKRCLQEEQAEPITVLLGVNQETFMSLKNPQQRYAVDCVFPILHGTLGEDGAMQGFLEIMNVPYVGSNVLGSALCMEKHIAKSLLRLAGLPTGDWIILKQHEVNNTTYEMITASLGEIVFVKPVGLGSSVGISKVRNLQEFEKALQLAFQYNDQIIIEKYIEGREIEISVLGNENPVASLPGEIIPHGEFYSYEAKYLDPDGAEVATPADLSETVVKKIQETAVAAYKVMHCCGMARIDFFVNGENVTINELNTIPGFTNISMYPKNWEVSGLPYSELLDNLIDLALARFNRQQAISHVRLSESDVQAQRPSPSID